MHSLSAIATLFGGIGMSQKSIRKSPTKKYVRRRGHKANFMNKVNLATKRGAVGARNIAYGVHWIKVSR